MQESAYDAQQFKGQVGQPVATTPSIAGIRASIDHPERNSSKDTSEEPSDDPEDEKRRLFHAMSLNQANPQHTSSSLEQAAATMMRQMLVDAVSERQLKKPSETSPRIINSGHPNTSSTTPATPQNTPVSSQPSSQITTQNSSTTQSPQQPHVTSLTNSEQIQPSSNQLLRASQESAHNTQEEDDESWFDDDLPTIKISIRMFFFLFISCSSVFSSFVFRLMFCLFSSQFFSFPFAFALHFLILPCFFLVFSPLQFLFTFYFFSLAFLSLFSFSFSPIDFL